MNYTEDQLEVDLLQDVQKCILKHIASLRLRLEQNHITVDQHDTILVKFERDLEEVRNKLEKLQPYGEKRECTEPNR